MLRPCAGGQERGNEGRGVTQCMARPWLVSPPWSCQDEEGRAFAILPCLQRPKHLTMRCFWSQSGLPEGACHSLGRISRGRCLLPGSPAGYAAPHGHVPLSLEPTPLEPTTLPSVPLSPHQSPDCSGPLCPGLPSFQLPDLCLCCVPFLGCLIHPPEAAVLPCLGSRQGKQLESTRRGYIPTLGLISCMAVGKWLPLWDLLFPQL